MIPWADPWISLVFSPFQPIEEVHNIEDLGFSSSRDFDQLKNLLHIDNIFDVIAKEGNEERVDYYILR